MTTEEKNTLYTDALVEDDTEGSLQSARIIVPVLLNLVSPTSVIDVGCGHGAWLKAFYENGVRMIHGLDGPWVDQSKLLIDRSKFKVVNLRQSFEIDGQFDLSVCLEVAEHLPAKAARPLVRSLCVSAPLVLFSAAIPGQRGTCHVNEQWPSYWRSLFSAYGFRRLDPIRFHVWQDNRVKWWYRQNIFLFASADAFEKSAVLQAEERRTCGSQLECVHEAILTRHASVRDILQQLPGAAFLAIKRRLCQ